MNIDQFMEDDAFFSEEFRDAEFLVCIDREELYRPFSRKDYIYVVCKFDCSHYNRHLVEHQVFIVRNKTEKGGICMEDVVRKLIDEKFDPLCSHRCFEGLRLLSVSNDEEFEVYESLWGN